MREHFLLIATGVLCFLIGCKRARGFEVPSDIGQGLSRADSLRALLGWLEGKRGYAADTLRLHVLYQLIEVIRSQNTDSAYALAQRLESVVQKSTYPPAKGLSELGWTLVYLNRAAYDSVFLRGRRALVLLEQSRHQKLQARALYLLGIGHHGQGIRDSARNYFERALSLSEAVGDKATQADACNRIGILHAEKGQYPQALEYFQKALTLREAIGDESGMAYSYNNVGLIYKAQGKYAEALDYYRKSLDICQAIGDRAGQASPYNNIGLIYEAQGRYADALEYYQKALAIQEIIGDKQALASLYTNIGNIYHSQNRHVEALEYQQKALALRQAIGDKKGLAASYQNIGNIYQAQGLYEEALDYYQKALDLRQAIQDIPGIAPTYNNIGLLHELQGQYAEALRYYQKSLQIKEALADKRGLTFSYVGIGSLYIKQGQLMLGRSYFQKALLLAQQLSAYDRLQEIYLALARTDSALAEAGQPTYWKTAYQYARLYTAYTDSVSNEKAIRKQAQLENQYENDKKIALLKAQQEKEQALAQERLRQAQIQRNWLMAVIAIILAGLGSLAYYQILLRRKNIRLKEANEALAKANRTIQDQADELIVKNDELSIFNAELKATNEALSEANRVIQAQAAELKEKNTELEASNRALNEYNQIIQAQAKELSEKNEDILDSIRYAEQIQRAILPSEEKCRRLLPDSFLVYLPKDIVAGDFYWLAETERYVFLGIADATGHGVPGAFVSLVCANALNKAVIEEGLESPADILGRAKEVVSALLTREGGRLRDGMDIALMRFEKEHPWQMVYAGANRPLWIVSHTREVIELAPTRQPIGYTEEEKSFEEVAVDVASRRPVMVYGFTDGIVDQMGGPKGRKLMAKGLKELLLGIADLPCEVQRERIAAFFAEWRGERRQMDDVTVVGVRVG